MPFGSGDRETLNRLATQLGDVAGELAALRQQVADQQHAIDRARQETTAAVTAGLNDIRATVRDGLDRGTERNSDTLTRIGSDLGVIRDGIQRLDRKTDEQAAAPSPAAPAEPAGAEGPEPPTEPAGHHDSVAAPEPGTAPSGHHDNTPPAPRDPETPATRPADGGETVGGETDGDGRILRAAAGIAHATIEAHRDTWAFLVQTAGREQHFHIPGKVEDDDGFVSVRVSGPSLVAAVTSLAQVAATAGNPVTRAIAAHIHHKITSAVRAVLDHPHSGHPGTPVRIVIDDRAAAAPGDGEGSERPGGE